MDFSTGEGGRVKEIESRNEMMMVKLIVWKANEKKIIGI
jgi:hypothetical protein